jgi:protein phosphatase
MPSIQTLGGGSSHNSYNNNSHQMPLGGGSGAMTSTSSSPGHLGASSPGTNISKATTTSAVGSPHFRLSHHHGHQQHSTASKEGPPTAPAFSCTVLSSQSRNSSRPLNLYVGSGCTQGFRPTMEDEHINMIGAKVVDGAPMSLFAVLDGHCGRRVATLGSEMLPEALFNHPQIGQNNAQAFVESIMQVDRQVYQAIRGQDGGCTLISALVHKRMCFVACLGDARAVLCDSGSAIPMSIDHKPTDPQEQARIVRCGGFVHFGRVSGCLAVSRALGDFEFKISMGRFVQKEFQVSNIADIRQINLTDGSRFLIVACDGLWDVMSNEEAVGWVSDYLNKHESSLRNSPNDVLNRASQAMVEHAVAKGSTDNVSATIILFHTPGS